MTDTDAPWIFRLRPGMISITFGREPLPSFGRREDEQEYRVIEDSDVAAALQDKEQLGDPMFQWMAPEDVDAALASAADAVEQIEAGEWDAHLAMLLVAERRVYGSRVTVLEAIAERNRVLVEEAASEGDEGDEDILAPGDIVTAGTQE